MSTALTGNAHPVGNQLLTGSNVYFDKLNQQGGIKGAKIKLLVKNDGYEPNQAIINTREFILNDQVDAILGSLGTSTSYAVLPIIQQFKTPYLMPFSGAKQLYTSNNDFVFNIRASYNDEAIEQVNYLIQEKGHTNVGILIQADEYGLVVENALTQALAQFKLKPKKIARYKRNSNDIQKALTLLKKSGVTAVFIVGSSHAAATFINRGFEQDFTPDYTSMSFTSNSHLFSRLLYPTSLMITQVLPEPQQCHLALCIEFLKDMAKKNIKQPSIFHLEGYLNALLFSTAAKHCEQPISKNCILENLKHPKKKEEHFRQLFTDEKGNKKLYRSYFKQTQ